MMKLESIYRYPIKSLTGQEVEIAWVRERGLEYDRRWMIIDNNGKCITQRENPLMAGLVCKMEDNTLIISSLLRPDLEFSIPVTPIDTGSRMEVSLWESNMSARHIGAGPDEFFSEALDQPCRLVYYDEACYRNANRLVTVVKTSVSFADAYPYLIISKASLDDLNRRLPEPIQMERFRPNLVIEGCEPYQEDHIRDLRIGNVHFRVVKKCARCAIPSIDPSTYEKGPEPLSTLSKYRTEANQVMFGVNAIALDYGEVKTGDAMEILSQSTIGI